MFGDGSSLAMTGAFTLVDALTVDIPSGLRDYEARHRPQRVAKENAVTPAANLFVPATRVWASPCATSPSTQCHWSSRSAKLHRGWRFPRRPVTEYSFAETR
jgi:hypothetical protein